MEEKVLEIIQINEDASEERKVDFIKYNAGDDMLIVAHQREGANWNHLRKTLHTHKYYEFEFVYSGRGTHLLGASTLPMKRGSVFLRTPNKLHTTFQEPNHPLQAYKIQFTDGFVPHEINARLLTDWDVFGACFFEEDEFSEILAKIQRLGSEIQEAKPYCNILISSIFHEILAMYLRKCEATEKYAHYSQHVTEALRYINNHFQGGICVKDMAKALHLTPHYLGSIFREEVGKSILEYKTELGLQIARQLLLNTDMMVHEISGACGFGNTAYFVGKFRMRFGSTPLQYRSKYQA